MPLRSVIVVPFPITEHVTGFFVERSTIDEPVLGDDAAELAQRVVEAIVQACGRVQLFQKLVEQRKKLHDLAHTDELTGCDTRRSIISYLDRELENARASGQPLSIVILDLDRFKEINDTCGHLAGDAVLRALGAWLGAEALRVNDRAGRYGGDEFVVVLPDTSAAGAAAFAERARGHFSGLPFVFGEHGGAGVAERRRGLVARGGRRHGRGADLPGRHGAVPGQAAGPQPDLRDARGGGGVNGSTRVRECEVRRRPLSSTSVLTHSRTSVLTYSPLPGPARNLRVPRRAGAVSYNRPHANDLPTADRRHHHDVAGGSHELPRVQLNAQYITAVEAPGATAVLLTPAQGTESIRRILDACDALLLTGGEDVEPQPLRPGAAPARSRR